MIPLTVGQLAPPFEVNAVGGKYGEGTTLSLGDLRGKTVVLYFYPKDETPGCTVQACALRDGWAELSHKAELFGVSIDSASSHQKFIKKHSLPFPLLVDEAHVIAESYGVWVEKNLYGHKSMGTERSTFVIGPDGVLQAIFRKVKPPEHLEQLLAVL